MSEAVIVALITGGLTLLGTILTVFCSQKSTLAALDKKSEVSNTKIHGEINTMKAEIQGQISGIRAEIKTLSERVDVHNNLIDRVYQLEKSAEVTGERLRHLGEDGK